MTKQLYLIDYESAHWCGGSSNVVVWAENKNHASELAEVHMEEDMRELFSGEYALTEDEEGDWYTEESAVSVNSVEEFGPTHDEWQFFLDPSQSQFYPVIGEPD